MATSTKIVGTDKDVVEKRARSIELAAWGIKTGADFADMMSALMSDLAEGKITPQVGNAIVNAGGKLLKVVELQYKYGTEGPQKSPKRILQLATGPKNEDENEDK